MSSNKYFNRKEIWIKTSEKIDWLREDIIQRLESYTKDNQVIPQCEISTFSASLKTYQAVILNTIDSILKQLEKDFNLEGEK